MRNFLILAFMLVAGTAQAGPYFRIEPFSEIKAGAFFELEASYEESRFGFVSPIIRHHAEDGHLLIKGVDWDLLNVGWSKATDSSRQLYTVGSSLHLGEPIKKILIKGVRLLPRGKSPDAYTFLKRVLAPSSKKAVYMDLGTNLGLQQPRKFTDWGKWKGIHLLSVTVNKSF